MHRARHSAAARVIRPRLVVAMVVAAAGLATAIWLPTRFDNAEATERGRDRAVDRVVFADDFAGPRGEPVNGDKWAFGPGAAGNGAGNGVKTTASAADGASTMDGRRREAGEPQFRTDSARLDGQGNLVIAAPAQEPGNPRCHHGRCRFPAATLRSTATFTGESGHAEARIKVPGGQGAPSAFQLLTVAGRDGGNPETLAEPGTLDQTAADRHLSDDFHTYAVDWTPDAVVWSIDGTELFRTDDRLSGPLTVALNLAVGGAETSRPGDAARLPRQIIVDFVRVVLGQPSATAPSSPPSSATPPSATPPAKTPPSSPPAARPWKEFTDYQAGDLVTFEGATYRVKDAHTSLPGWEPNNLPNLFQKV